MTLERAVAFDRWEHQWVRALRWYKRTLEATGRETGRGSLDAADFSEALVQAVWHLRDWLVNDPRIALPAEKLKAFTTGDSALQLVADVANGTKHSWLNARRTNGVVVGHTAWFGSGDIDDPESIERVRITATIEAESGEPEHRELVDIAWDGLVAWRRWLTVMGIDIPEIPELPSP
jgi:hypothetical protein